MRSIERTPVSLNLYFAEVLKITAKEKPYKNVFSKKYNDTMYTKLSFYKPISKMP
jgi:hypothetical protein